jgi:hypothetical protein
MSYRLRYQLGLAVPPVAAGPELSPLFQAYIDLMSDLDPEQWRLVSFNQSDETIVAGLTDDPGRIAAGLVKYLDGLDCRLDLGADSYLPYLMSLNCASLELAISDNYNELADVSALDLANLTKLRTESFEPFYSHTHPDNKWPGVTSLAYANPTEAGLEPVSYFPDLTELTLILPDEQGIHGGVFMWEPQNLLDSKVTSLTIGTSSDRWSAADWRPDWLTRPAASLVDWLTTNPGVLQTINGEPVADFDYRAHSDITAEQLTQYRTDQITSTAQNLTSNFGAVGVPVTGLPTLDGGLIIDLAPDLPRNSWQPSFSNGPEGKDFLGVPADYLPVIRDEIRYVAVISLRPGEAGDWYTDAATGQRLGQAFQGITSVTVYDCTDSFVYGPFDTAVTDPPDQTSGVGDNWGEVKPQSAVDWLIAHLTPP